MFLYGTLSEVVYMQQPPGFVDHNNSGFICKLRKAIYGLKQAPRAWCTKLNGFLLSYGFVNSHSDASLFIYYQNSITYYFLVYVNDLIVTGNCNKFLKCFLQALVKCFSIKDLGDSTIFLVLRCFQPPLDFSLLSTSIFETYLNGLTWLVLRNVLHPRFLARLL